MQHLHSLVLDKIRVVGIIAEDAVLAVDMLQTGKGLVRITNLITES